MKNDKAQDGKKVDAAAPGEIEASAVAQVAAVKVPAVTSLRRKAPPPARINMLRVVAAFLSILWMLGVVASYTLDGNIHIVLMLAMVLLITDRLVPPKTT